MNEFMKKLAGMVLPSWMNLGGAEKAAENSAAILGGGLRLDNLATEPV